VSAHVMCTHWRYQWVHTLCALTECTSECTRYVHTLKVPVSAHVMCTHWMYQYYICIWP